METSFLDCYKVILSKVSFDQALLNKKFLKALNMLSEQEANELFAWVREMELYVLDNQASLKKTA